MQNKSASQQIIMGVDPGTNVLGYSIICTDKNTIRILTQGVIHLKKIENHFHKLRSIYDNIDMIIKKYNPVSLAIEAPFYGKNIQSMLKLGRAQGTVILAAAHHNLEIIEYSPRKIKQSITGKGNASKAQVAYMLKSIFQMQTLPEYFDETDALAVAVCHYNSIKKFTIKTTAFNNWNDYVKSNPEKIVKNLNK
ncbi:MAG: crossover junction endodeoxyribonuclease RuvC [Fimbriimonadaceae bacterium]|nr:crossover junction endodeoxyribonuclease RuvC [Chitinophagales bacterium]